jgi:enamine deaminase RidA (YjgF/YER057c/UK114 family)
MSFRVEHLNPPGLRRNPAFTNVIVMTGPAKWIVIGAIDPVDETGALVGRGDLAAQTEQVFKNLEVSLSAAGARLEDIIIWRIFIVQGESVETGARVFQRVWGQRPNPPANTIVFVPALGYPGSLICLEAEAVVSG